MDDEKMDLNTAEPAKADISAAPADGQPPRKKKKKRPADGSASAEMRTASAGEHSAQSGDVPHKKKKKRPADGSASSELRTASAGEHSAQSGDVPHKKKKKRPADGSASAETRTASAGEHSAQSGDVPHKKKKKRPVDGSASTELRTASAGEHSAQSGDVPHKKKKKRPADGSASAELRTASAEERSAQSGDVPHKKKKKRPADGSASAEVRTASAEERSAQSGDVPHKKKKSRPADSSAPAVSRTVSADIPRQQPAVSRSAETSLPKQGFQLIKNSITEKYTALLSRDKAVAADSSVRLLTTKAFAIFIVLFIIVLSFVILGMNKKAKNYLSEYENSRPQYTIEEYVASLDSSFVTEMMTQSASSLEFSAYEKPEMLYDAVRSQAAGSGEYTYSQAEDFTESRPDYYILQDGKAIAKVALIRSGWTEAHSFPVWRVDTPASVIDLQASPSYTLNVTMPEDAVLQVNGVEVPEEQYLEAESDLKLCQTELYFMKQPMARKCVINGLFCAPQVTVKDADGNVLEPYETPDTTQAELEYVFPIADSKDPDPKLKERVDGLTKAYMNYVINTKCDLNNNLAVLSNYLVAGSPASTLMYNISTDIWYNNDPDLREDHVFEIKHIKRYADNLCTVDVRLESTLGKVAVNDYACTIRWVMVDTGYGWYATSFRLFP